jgi:ATP-binding cassette subfamily B protein
MATPAYADITLLRRLLRQARPYWPYVGGIFLLDLLASPLALLAPLPLKIIVDSVVGSHRPPRFLTLLWPTPTGPSPTALLVLAVCLYLAIALLDELQHLGTAFLSTYTGELLILDFRARLFHQVQRLSFLYHDARGTADATYRIQYDAPAIRNIIVTGVIPVLTAIVALGAMLYVMARIDWQLAVVALAIAPVHVGLSWAYRPRLRRQARRVKTLESAALAVVQEVLAALRVVRAFGQERREQDRFVQQSGENMRARLHLALVEESFSLLMGLTTAAGTAAVLFIGIRHVQAGVLTLGDLLMVLGYLSQLYAPLRTLSRKGADVQSALASAERAFALLDEAPDVPERPHARPLGRARGAITFRHVSFAYGDEAPVLHDISFAVPEGTWVGIRGATGAGKTTLVSLLTRFYDPTAGHILLDGVDLRDYALADLRTQFGIVLQEPLLFSTTIAENIAYACPAASQHAIVAAARAANAHEFIVGLPEGYQTRVGERGMRLSGGERQRLSLARAFLKDAPIVILDEPTSAVDTQTEAAIMEACERLMHGRTTFIIAHRLSTLDTCDVWLDIQDGRLRAARPVGPRRKEDVP